MLIFSNSILIITIQNKENSNNEAFFIPKTEKKRLKTSGMFQNDLPQRRKRKTTIP